MIDIDGLMDLFGEMQKAGIENLRIAMDDKNGMKFNLVITPPARCVGVQPVPAWKAPEKEPEKAPEAPEESEEKAPEPEKMTLSNEAIKNAIEEAVGKSKRGGRPRKDKAKDQILDDMARKRGEF